MFMFCIFTLVRTSPSMYAVPNMAVFSGSFISCFPGTLLKYFQNDFEMIPVIHVITVNHSFTSYMHCISVVRSLYVTIFSISFLITLLSTEIATFINIHAPCSLSRVMMSGLLLGMVLSVFTFDS